VALSIKEHTFIESLRAAGSGHVRIATAHILPNVMPTIIVVATTGLSTVILTEASLSFLGLGVPSRSRSPCSASTCWATRCATCWTRASRDAGRALYEAI
jgi:ABC-type microcin C transport system permease subunit YejE